MRFAKLLSFVKPKRHWAQFSLGTMLLVMTILCLFLADFVNPVRRLERQLRDPDEELREYAAERLGFMGSEGRSAMKSLLRATEDSSSPVRLKAIWALSRVSDRPDLLAPLLNGSDDDVSLAAAEGMLWMRDDPRKIIPKLLELYDNGLTDQGVEPIFEALGPEQSTVVVPLLLDSLLSTDEALQSEGNDPAAGALRVVALPSAAVVPALIERLNDERSEVRTAAAEQLLRLRASAKDAAPALRARLQDPDPACAAACAAALFVVDPGDADFLRVLRRSLRSDVFGLPDRVDDYLFMIGPAGAGAADDLVDFLCDRQRLRFSADGGNALKRLGPPAVSALDRRLKQALAAPGHASGSAAEIALWLAFIGRLAAPTVPTLISALERADARYQAVVALGRVGEDAAVAVPHLLPYVDSKDTALQYAAFTTLKEVGGNDETGRAHFRPLLASADRNERLWAAILLAEFGEPAEQILPTLINLAIDPHFSDGAGLPRGESYSAVGDTLTASMASLGPAAASDLIHALRNPNAKVRRVAAEALGKMQPSAHDSIPPLIELLDDGLVWDAAAEALGRIGPKASEAVPKLVEWLRALHQTHDPSSDVSKNQSDSVQNVLILHALAGIGMAANAATPEVSRLANSDDAEIRQAAVLTLARIAPDSPSLISRMRRILAEYERESATNDDHGGWVFEDPLAKFADAVWDLGARAEPLSGDLLHIMTMDRLIDRRVRCYAAFALAGLASHRQTATAYLERVIDSGFPESFGSVNLAHALLQAINGAKDDGEWLMTPLGVGP